jgi:hypothetical protein
MLFLLELEPSFRLVLVKLQQEVLEQRLPLLLLLHSHRKQAPRRQRSQETQTHLVYSVFINLN